MKIFHIILRTGLGLMLLVFGLNKFFWFMPDFDFTGFPEAEHLFNTLRFSGHGNEGTGHGYIMNLVGFFEAVIGLLLIVKKWVPLALAMLIPISINIVAFHIMVNLPNLGPAVAVAVVNVYLMYVNRASYSTLLS